MKHLWARNKNGERRGRIIYECVHCGTKKQIVDGRRMPAVKQPGDETFVFKKMPPCYLLKDHNEVPQLRV